MDMVYLCMVDNVDCCEMVGLFWIGLWVCLPTGMQLVYFLIWLWIWVNAILRMFILNQDVKQ